FLIRQVIEQLPDARILGPRRCLLIKTAGLQFNRTCLLTHGFEAERSYQPYRRALNKSADILAANQWDMLPEFLPIKLNQPAPVAGLFLPHAVTDGSRGREGLTQPFGKIGVHSFVFFLEGNG